MKKQHTLAIVLLLLAPYAFAQQIETDTISKKAVQKLAFITGEWEGQGWVIGQDRIRREFDQYEKISFKLDSTLLLVEGKGTNKGKVMHDALALVTFNKEDGNYSFSSNLANGMKGTYKAELIDDVFHWYPMENMRYIISINEKGQWHEIGEINMNEQWYKFFEMTLDKVKVN